MKDQITVTREDFEEEVKASLRKVAEVASDSGISASEAMAVGFGASLALAKIKTALFREDEKIKVKED